MSYIHRSKVHSPEILEQ